MTRPLLLACLLTGAGLLLPAVSGKPALADDLKASPAEMKIEEALKSPTQLEFTETPLQEVIEYLKDTHKIEIQVANKALNDTGVPRDTPITRNLKGVSLRSALRLMLRELDLTYVVRDEVLLITTPEEAEAHQVIRVYQVGDLTRTPDASESKKLDPQALADMIHDCVDATAWSDVGGPGEIRATCAGNADVLVVTQSYAVHQKIAALLAELREAAGTRPEAKAATATKKK